MPLYEFECSNQICMVKNKPHEFDESLPLSKTDEKPNCPKCGKNNFVKKVIRSPFPKSQSWRAH